MISLNILNKYILLIPELKDSMKPYEPFSSANIITHYPFREPEIAKNGNVS